MGILIWLVFHLIQFSKYKAIYFFLLIFIWQVVTGAGPLMSEPLYGVGFVIESIEMGRKVAGSGLSDDEMDSFSIAEMRNEYEREFNGREIDKSKEEEKEKEKEKEKEREKEKEKDSSKGDLLLGKLISDSIEAFRLAFLSCPVSTYNYLTRKLVR